MMHSQYALLGTRRFLPLFITQLLGAFNDNVFKNALVILISYKLADQAGLDPGLMVTAAAGIFILPFFLFSAIAGQLADRFDKSFLIRTLKLTEIVLMLFAVLAFQFQNPWFLLLMLFLMGSQSAFFGPIKYGILPNHLHDDELISGNALIQAATFLAILLGTVVGGILILSSAGVTVISVLIVTAAITGWFASRYIPATKPAAPNLRINPNIMTETWHIVRAAAEKRDVFLSILGISWFWLVGATFLSQFPTFGKQVLGGDEGLVTFLLIIFSVGIGVGSLFCNRMLKGAVHATYVPLGALGITLFSVDLFFASQHVAVAADSTYITVAGFLESFTGWRIVFDILMIAISGGLYIVPLNTLVQLRSDASRRSRNIAANNILNSLFMVVSAVGTAVLLASGYSVPQVFLGVAILNAGVAFYITRLLPGALVKSFIAWLLELFFRVEIRGMEHYRAAGKKALIVSNHQSLLDPLLIAAYVPDDLTFAINTYTARNPLIRFFLSLARTYTLDPSNPLSTRTLIKSIKNSDRVVLFPEGRITVTGSLMKIYEGAGMVADKSNAVILPVRIDGAQYSRFSHLKGKVRTRWFPRVRVTYLPPRYFDVPEHLHGRERREFAGQKLHDLMRDMFFESSDHHKTLFESLLDAADTHGHQHKVLEGIDRRPIHYRRLIAESFVFGRMMAARTAAGEYVGILLPTCIETVVSFFALQAYGRVPTMLNYLSDESGVATACKTANLKTIYSSRRFVETAQLENIITAIEQTGAKIKYLEDVQQDISLPARLLGALASRVPRLAYRLSDRQRNPQSASTVLFTSGTETEPKGVVLSHSNIQANRFQVSSCIDFSPADIVFNPLPLFQAFGLTCGTLLPLLSGIRTFLYPSPHHHRIVPEVVYDSNATILFGTDTYLASYARSAHPYDFYSLRYVVSGAEKLQDETRQLWTQQFGIRIFEGYGTTETAPVLALNTPMQNRSGSVGRLLPNIRHRLENMPGADGGGRLQVAGPNIMMGYLQADKPGELGSPDNGWYDTDDIVTIDQDGFVFIKQRAHTVTTDNQA